MPVLRDAIKKHRSIDNARCFHFGPEKIAGIIIYLSFSDDVSLPEAFCVCAFSFFFYAF
jgi:hypothetical protein